MEEIIVGRNAVREALRGERQIRQLLVGEEQQQGSIHEILRLAKEKRIDVRRVPIKKLNQYSPDIKHQGVVAFINAASFVEIDEVLKKSVEKKENPLFILLDGIEDTHNMGAIIRTAECVGADAVLIPKRHNAPINATVAKTSAGAIESIDLVQVGNVVQTLDKLKEAGFWILGAHMEGQVSLYEADMRGPTVLVIGNEGKGMSRLTKENCDILVTIPMYGKINSLNASVAAAVLLYEAVRQRQ